MPDLEIGLLDLAGKTTDGPPLSGLAVRAPPAHAVAPRNRSGAHRLRAAPVAARVDLRHVGWAGT